MDNHKFKDRGGIEEGKCRTPKIFWYHCHSIDKTEDTKMVYKIKCASGICGRRHYFILPKHNYIITIFGLV